MYLCLIDFYHFIDFYFFFSLLLYFKELEETRIYSIVYKIKVFVIKLQELQLWSSLNKVFTCLYLSSAQMHAGKALKHQIKKIKIIKNRIMKQLGGKQM